MSTLRERAKRRNVSLSRYAVNRPSLDRLETGWPEGYWDVFGALKDDSFTVPEELDASLYQPVSFEEG